MLRTCKLGLIGGPAKKEKTPGKVGGNFPRFTGLITNETALPSGAVKDSIERGIPVKGANFCRQVIKTNPRKYTSLSSKRKRRTRYW